MITEEAIDLGFAPAPNGHHASKKAFPYHGRAARRSESSMCTDKESYLIPMMSTPLNGLHLLLETSSSRAGLTRGDSEAIRTDHQPFRKDKWRTGSSSRGQSVRKRPKSRAVCHEDIYVHTRPEATQGKKNPRQSRDSEVRTPCVESIHRCTECRKQNGVVIGQTSPATRHRATGGWKNPRL